MFTEKPKRKTFDKEAIPLLKLLEGKKGLVRLKEKIVSVVIRVPKSNDSHANVFKRAINLCRSLRVK